MNSIVTLDQFVRRSELLQFLNDAKNSNLYILYLNYRYYVKNTKVKSPKADQFYVKYLIKITKINVISKYAYGWLKDSNVEWVQYGPIVVEQYTALNLLQNQGYIKIEKAPSGYIFSWDKIPGNDNGRLIEFLEQNFGIDWADTAKIEKIDDGATVKVSTENNYLSLKLTNEKTKVILTIDDGRTDKFIANMENNELNIYLDDRFSFQFRITEEGVKLIEEKLNGIDINTDLSANVPFDDEIINLLRLENDELVNIATEYFGNKNYFKVNNIGEFKIIQIFDWTEFGNGSWKKCYDTLLWSLQSMDESGRFRTRDANLFGFSYKNIDEKYYFKPKNNETLRSVFQKSLPPKLYENKIEAKNYIIHDFRTNPFY